MIIRLKNSEISVLLLHMAMNRKGVRNVFKKNKEGKELLKSFDEVKESLEIVINEVEEEDYNLQTNLYYNIGEIRLLQSFLSYYIPLLEKTLKQAGNILNEDQKQLDVLKMIEDKTNRLKEGAASV